MRGEDATHSNNAYYSNVISNQANQKNQLNPGSDMRRFIVLLLCFAYFTNACAQEWQWSIPVKNAKEGNGEARAFLWVPPYCKLLKGVVMAQNNMEEQSILESPLFRRKMAELDFAEVWVSPSFDHLFRFNEGAGDIFNTMMNDLADSSGYAELKQVPLVPIGHSASASWPYYFAAWDPQRTLTAISVSGQWPLFRDAVFAPDIWGDKNIDFVPCLETMGEYEAANTWSAEGLKERVEHPLMPLSMLACPAEGHFAASDKKIAYIALYIKKAVEYRLIKPATLTTPALLKPINPTQAGWLVDKWRLNEKPIAKAAPVNKYKGNKAEAFWFFDDEMAKATEEYQSAERFKKAALLGYVQDGKIVPQKNTHQQVDLAFKPLQDGITFILKATFLDTVPSAHKRTSEWTGLPAGSPVGHPPNSYAIQIQRIAGPFEKINDSIFRLRLEKGISSKAANYAFWFAAKHPGDMHYKPAVQQAQMLVVSSNSNGVAQHIIFDSVINQLASLKSIKLHAVSSASLPVQFYVKEGPAFIKDDTLVVDKIPVRSRYPVKITVVAWQYGRNTEPAIQTAKPVERSFYLIK